MRARSIVVLGLWFLVLGALACSEGREPVDTSDGGGGVEDGGEGPSRGLTPVATGNAYQIFRALRAPDGTIFVVGADSGQWPMLRILPDRTTKEDGPLHESGANMVDEGRLGVSSDGTVRWFWGEIVDAEVSRIQVRRFEPGSATWSPPETAAEGANVSGVFGANVSATGDEILAWDEATDVWAVRHTASGWSVPEQLDPPDDPNGRSYYAGGAILAGAASGEALVAWDESGRLRASLYTPGSGWATTPVPDVPFRKADARWAAMDDAGRAAILWVEGGKELHAVVYDGSAWSADAVVDAGARFGPVSVAILDGGGVVALASDEGSGGANRLTLYAFDGSAWGKHTLSEALGAFAYSLLAVPGGRTVAVYAELDLGAALPGYVLRSVTFDPASGPSSPRTVAPQWLDPPNALQLLVGDGGEVWALWSETSLTAGQTYLYLEKVP